MLVVVLVKCGGGGGHKNLVYNQNVILSKPKVVSASGTWSGLNTTQFYGQIVQLDRIKQRNSASIFSGFLLKFQPQQQPSRYCGRGQSTRFKCDPSFGCGNVCVMGGETEPNLSSLGRRPVLRCYIILGEAGKCCSAGENGKKLPGWGWGEEIKWSILDNPLFSQSDLHPVRQMEAEEARLCLDLVWVLPGIRDPLLPLGNPWQRQQWVRPSALCGRPP